MDPPAWVVEELKKPRDYTADLKKLLASANICDKRWVFEQYDSMVQSNTVQGPGGEAGVMRIKGTGSADRHEGVLGELAKLVAESSPEGEAMLATGNPEATNPVVAPGASHESSAKKPERGLAMALAGNGRWCWLDPKLGAMHAVAEACTALGTPITGGNVSFYNETRGEGIYPTPVMGIVGLLEDVSKAVPAAFQKAGDAILLLTLPVGTTGTRPDREFGSTEFAKTILQTQWGTPPCMQLLEEFELHNALQALAKRGLIHSASDVSDGGLAVALARACIPNNVGVRISLHPQFPFEKSGVRDLFGEDSSLALVTCDPSNVDVLKQVVDEFGFVFPMNLGETIEPSKSVEADFEISFPGRGSAVSTTLSELRAAYATTLESQLAAEVVTA
jgi:phosphoribosylformylglycinamidine synthase